MFYVILCFSSLLVQSIVTSICVILCFSRMLVQSIVTSMCGVRFA